jgi:hypothetical protein
MPQKPIKRLSSPETQVATALKRCRTVRAMIEDSVRKNADFERAHQASFQRMTAAHPSFKVQENRATTRLVRIFIPDVVELFELTGASK